MTAPANLPSLFGRFTAILKDHEHLSTSLRQLRAMCLSLETLQFLPATFAPLDLLEELRADLSGHFAAEEADAYFGTIVLEAPLLATRIGQLKTEHTAMLSAAASLCRVAADTGRAAELCESTRRLIVELERHERAESLLLRELFASGS